MAPNFYATSPAPPSASTKTANGTGFSAAAAQKAGIPLIYCNNVGIQNNGKNIFTFDGCSCVYGSDGWLLTDAPMYAEATLCAGWDSKAKAIDTSGITSDPRSEIDEVYHSLRYGCQRFLEQAGIGKMTIGLPAASTVPSPPPCLSTSWVLTTFCWSICPAATTRP